MKRFLQVFGKELLLVIATVLVLYFISWVLTVLIIKLITLCFNLTFDLWIATGIWLIIRLVKSLISKVTK